MSHAHSRFHGAPDHEGRHDVEYHDLFDAPALEDPGAAFSGENLDPSTPTQAEAKGAARREAHRLIEKYGYPVSLIVGFSKAVCDEHGSARAGGERQ